MMNPVPWLQMTNMISYQGLVRTFPNTEPTGNCTFLGEVTGSQGNFFTGGWTSNSNLETGARNDLKNQAYSMGGNVVVILTQRAGQTGSAYFGSGSSQQTNVTLSGTVYRCNN